MLQCGIATMWVICSSLHVSANVTESNKYNLGVVQITPLNCPKSLIACDRSATINLLVHLASRCSAFDEFDSA